MKQILIACTALLVSISSLAQTSHKRCGTMDWLKSMYQKYPEYKGQMVQNESKLATQIQQKKMAQKQSQGQKTNGITIIPVVFHIVLPNPSVVTDAQIQAQLDTLNKDWAGLNGDSVKILPQFKDVFGKGQIRFCLAQRTPNNLPTSGIRRITSNTKSTLSAGDPMKFSANGGQDAWDPTKYINIWVGRFTDNSLLGYATFPVGSPENGGMFPLNEQGIVLNYETLPGGTGAPYNRGRTATHEMGHFLLLRHIWGDETCGNDEVHDTPVQSDETYGCHDSTKVSGCNSDPKGRMYQNFMDYTDDACMVMFTKGQNERAEAALTAFRNSLTTSDGCTPVVPIANNASLQAILRPENNTSVCVPTSQAAVTLLNAGTNTLNSVVINYQIGIGPTLSYNWTGTLLPYTTTTVNLPNINLTSTVNNLVMYTSLPNGMEDSDKSNDTARVTVHLAPRVSLPFTEGFEGSTFPPAGWFISQTPPDNITWKRTTSAAASGQASAYMDNYNYDDGVVAFFGRHDDLITPILVFQDVDSVFLKFRYAAATLTDFPPDTLEIAITRDCGVTYQTVFKKWGADLATNGLANTEDEFVPSQNHWRVDSVNITTIVGNTGEFRIRFRNTENYGNNIFLDDIQVYTKTLPARLKAEGLLISPNPVTNTFVVQHLFPPTSLRGVSVFDGRGNRVYFQAYNGNAATYIPISLGMLPAGIYYLKLDYHGQEPVTKKIVKL